MSRLLQWGAIHISRRKFLRRAAAGVFGVTAGLAVGLPHAIAEAPCSGANGASQCDPCLCSSNGQCRSGCGAACQNTGGCGSGSCGGASHCWCGLDGKACCDCACRSGSFGWYCWCHAA